MRKKIFRNWGLKIISLVMASFIWIIVAQMGDPPDKRDMGNIIVKLTNTELLEKENKVYEILDHSDVVRVTVNAPRSVFERLRSSDIVAEADVGRLTDISTVPITFSSSISNVLSIQGNRETVKLSVEDRASKYVYLDSRTAGQVAEGYMVTSITPDQNRIEVSGPKSVVDRVKYAGVEIDVSEATSNLTANIDINLYDSEGNTVEHANLVKNVDYVRLSVEVLAVKDVPIELRVNGEPAEGYMMTGEMEHDPLEVKIAGSVYALSRINAITIPGDKLDITGLKDNLETTVDIRDYLPANIKIADSDFNGRVKVTIFVEAVQERTLRIPANNISLANVPEGINAEIAAEEGEELQEYLLDVQGLGRLIDPLQQAAVVGTVDVAAWMQKIGANELKPGTYEIPVTFKLDDEIKIVTPLNVQVTVKELVVENENE